MSQQILILKLKRIDCNFAICYPDVRSMVAEKKKEAKVKLKSLVLVVGKSRDLKLPLNGDLIKSSFSLF